MSGRNNVNDWLAHPKRYVEHLPNESVHNPTWMEHAACASTDTESYFPEGSHDANTRAAKALCMRCTVRVACLEHAIALDINFHTRTLGIWGGLTERQRRALVLKRKAQQA